jgi:hypothetical protein
MPQGTSAPSISRIFSPRPFREKNTAGSDAHKNQIFYALVFFQDFIGDPGQRSVDFRLHSMTTFLGVSSSVPFMYSVFQVRKVHEISVAHMKLRLFNKKSLPILA